MFCIYCADHNSGQHKPCYYCGRNAHNTGEHKPCAHCRGNDHSSGEHKPCVHCGSNAHETNAHGAEGRGMACYALCPPLSLPANRIQRFVTAQINRPA